MFFKMLSAKEARRIAKEGSFLTKIDRTMLESISMGIDAACKHKKTVYLFKMWNVDSSHENIIKVLEENGYKVNYWEQDCDGLLVRFIKIQW